MRPLVLALIVLLVWAPSASAHATMIRTTPSDTSVVRGAPKTVQLRWSEPVDLGPGSVRLLDAQGGELDTPAPKHVRGDPATAVLRVPAGLDDGTYVVAWRVTSADSHPVSGAFSFSVGAPSALVVAGEPGATSGAVSMADGVARAVAFLGFALAIGAACLLLLGGLHGRRARTVLWGGIASLAAATVILLVLQGPYATGGSLLDPSLLGFSLSTPFGQALVVRLLLLAVFAALVARALRTELVGEARDALAPPRSGGGGAAAFAPRLTRSAVAGPPPPAAAQATAVPAARAGAVPAARAGAVPAVQAGAVPAVQAGAVPAAHATAARRASSPAPVSRGAIVPIAAVTVALTFTWTLADHSRTGVQPWLGVPAASVHLLAMGLWFGGLVTLLVSATVPRQAVERFSRLALGCFAALGVTGVYLAWRQSGELAALPATGFGLLLLIKTGLVLGIVGLAALSRRAVARDGDIRRSVRAEAVVGVAVLAVTAALVNAVPARVGYAPPFDATVAGMDGGTVQVHLEPAKVGENVADVYLVAPGGRLLIPPEVTARVVRDEESLPVTLGSAEPGHYVATALSVPSPGDWTLRLTVRTSEIDEQTIDVPVKVR